MLGMLSCDHCKTQNWLSPKPKDLQTPQDARGWHAVIERGHQRSLRSLQVGRVGDVYAHAVQELVIYYLGLVQWGRALVLRSRSASSASCAAVSSAM